ncbi:hypothetical protein CONLIGDRAFT_142456 [Coniochaeta ligniaria NRRL 30616]|uniref:Uncharacterized protein n=1 Tax=Coniochaeta ligniaria NRRL 30616 TaxID=1408157 RepID=A0A1J7I7N5_9PEZI|nr:hypothetical protein CONLIGDRAFT_142456 [Coniochaeta ligniaria NRRL 30616]
MPARSTSKGVKRMLSKRLAKRRNSTTPALRRPSYVLRFTKSSTPSTSWSPHDTHPASRDTAMIYDGEPARGLKVTLAGAAAEFSTAILVSVLPSTQLSLLCSVRQTSANPLIWCLWAMSTLIWLSEPVSTARLQQSLNTVTKRQPAGKEAYPCRQTPSPYKGEMEASKDRGRAQKERPASSPPHAEQSSKSLIGEATGDINTKRTGIH